MDRSTEVRSRRGASVAMGVLLAAFAAGAVYVALWTSEADLLNARVRRGGGLVKMVEQTIGWNAFVVLMLIVALLLAVYAVAFLWRAIDARADVAILSDRLEFHPAIRPKAALFDDVRSWAVERLDEGVTIRMTFHQSYWSLQGLVPRKSLKIEGPPAAIGAFLDQLDRHPVLGAKRQS